MRIIVCGDSFCTSEVHNRKHFSQVLKDTYGYNTLSIAHGGMSNVGIWFQIREAILMQPDVIVYNQTSSSRVEIMVNEHQFNISKGLKNIVYFDPNYSSTHLSCVGNKQTGTVISTVWQGLDSNPFIEISAEQIQAVDMYLKHLYHDDVKTNTDAWMFEYWQLKIEQAGILGIKFNDNDIGKIAYTYSNNNPKVRFSCPYHTDAATQEIVAANIHNRVLNNLNG